MLKRDVLNYVLCNRYTCLWLDLIKVSRSAIVERTFQLAIHLDGSIELLDNRVATLLVLRLVPLHHFVQLVVCMNFAAARTKIRVANTGGNVDLGG